MKRYINRSLSEWWISVKWMKRKKIDRQSALANPLKLLWVSPSDITYVTSPSAEVDWTPPELHKHRDREIAWFNPRSRIGSVIGGEWDKPECEVEDLCTYRSFKNHFVGGLPWEETEFYQREIEYLEEIGTHYNCESEQEFRDVRCAYLDYLFGRMKHNGYESQDDAPGDERNKSRLHEVTVNIGRDGELLFNVYGQHRLSMAKLLDIPQIPVIVIARHDVWQQIRDKTQKSRAPDEYNGHPDLQDIE